MKIRLRNHSEFLNAIYDYVAENYAIELQSFVIDTRPVSGSLIYSDLEVLGCYRLAAYPHCRAYNSHLHVHESNRVAVDNEEEEEHRRVISPTVLHCCTEVDTLAIRYLNESLVSPDREMILFSLHHWLPSATSAHVSVTFAPNESVVESYYEPSFAVSFLYAQALDTCRLEYRYFVRNIDLQYADSADELQVSYSVVNKETNREIMVRRRSRSRSRSPGRPKSVGRPRTRRRRRSTSSKRTASPVRSYRRRSRSRSRSSSRSRR